MVISTRDEYLAGFVAQSYQVDLVTGFETAKAIVHRKSPHHRIDIGGDHQRIFTVDTKYFNTFFSTSCCRCGSAPIATRQEPFVS